MSTVPTPQLLALDWGTSSLRAFLMHDGKVTDTRHSAHGIQHLPLPGVPGYEGAFAEIAGDDVAGHTLPARLLADAAARPFLNPAGLCAELAALPAVVGDRS